MDRIFEQYFDFDIMRDNFRNVLDGFWLTIKLALVAGVLSLIWGLVLAVLRRARALQLPCAADHRLHRHLPRRSRCCW